MLSKSDRHRLNELRNRQAEGIALSVGEITEIVALTIQIENAERTRLAPSFDKLRAENAATEERIRALELLADRQQQFVARVQATLAEIQTERAELAAERQRLTAPAQHSGRL